MKVTKNILREIIEAEIKEAEVTPATWGGALQDRAASRRQVADQEVDQAYERTQLENNLDLLRHLAAGNSILQKGSQNKGHVEALQKILLIRLEENGESAAADAMKAATTDRTGVDGIFGGKTEAAVIALQQKYRIDVDGTVGKQTFAALEDNAKRQGVASSNVRTAVNDTDDTGDTGEARVFEQDDEVTLTSKSGKQIMWQFGQCGRAAAPCLHTSMLLSEDPDLQILADRGRQWFARITESLGFQVAFADLGDVYEWTFQQSDWAEANIQPKGDDANGPQANEDPLWARFKAFNRVSESVDQKTGETILSEARFKKLAGI